MDWVEIRDMLGLNITPDQLRKQAVGYDEYDAWIHGNDGVSTRILSISDAHVPFNLPAEIFKDYAYRVDILVFNGDIEDCWSCSSFPRRYRVGLDEEMILTRQYMIDVINMICPKKVLVLMGNHEYRLGRHLTDKLNDDILSIMPDTPLELIVNHGFRVKDRPIGFGEVVCVKMFPFKLCSIKGDVPTNGTPIIINSIQYSATFFNNPTTPTNFNSSSRT